MKEYIEREVVLKEQQEICYWNGLEDRYDDFVPVQIIEKIPAAEVEPVRHGEWIPIVNHSHGKPDGRYYCSECRRVVNKYERYCPDCGAHMDGGKESLPFGIQRSAEEVGSALKVLHDEIFTDGGNK